MNIERLTILAKFLETVQDNKLDLYSWRNNTATVINSYDVLDEALIHDCNTTACAMGWACVIPEFKAAGLSYSVPFGSIVYYSKRPNSFSETRYTAYQAVEMFFNLKDYTTATYLFSPLRYLSVEDIRDERNPTKSEVIKRILKLISFSGTQETQYEDEQQFIKWCISENEAEEKRYNDSLKMGIQHGS